MNHYAAAIDILSAHQTDWFRLVAEIAKHNPEAVTAAHARLNPGLPLEARCKALMFANEKIKAIKLWQEETGACLGDARKAVEAL